MSIPIDGSTLSVFDHLLYNLDEPSFNIAIIGEVSSGKTTFLNSLFLEKFGETKRIRTTGSVNIYSEYDNQDQDSSQSIKSNNKKIDTAFQLNSSSQNTEVIINHYKSPVISHFKRHKTEPIDLNIIDIPGVNDSADSAKFFNWIKSHFNYFDIIVFIMDGQQAMNTKSQKDLTELIVNLINPMYQSLIPILNKFDDSCDEELIEIKEQCERVLDETIQKLKPQLTYKICPMSAENAFVLLKWRHENSIDGMDSKSIRILCDAILGKNWKKEIFRKTKTNDEIKAMTNFEAPDVKKLITTILQKERKNTINELIDETGYRTFINQMNEYFKNSSDYIQQKRLVVEARMMYMYFSKMQSKVSQYTPTLFTEGRKLLGEFFGSSDPDTNTWLKTNGIPIAIHELNGKKGITCIPILENVDSSWTKCYSKLNNYDIFDDIINYHQSSNNNTMEQINKIMLQSFLEHYIYTDDYVKLHRLCTDYLNDTGQSDIKKHITTIIQQIGIKKYGKIVDIIGCMYSQEERDDTIITFIQSRIDICDFKKLVGPHNGSFTRFQISQEDTDFMLSNLANTSNNINIKILLIKLEIRIMIAEFIISTNYPVRYQLNYLINNYRNTISKNWFDEFMFLINLPLTVQHSVLHASALNDFNNYNNDPKTVFTKEFQNLCKNIEIVDTPTQTGYNFINNIIKYITSKIIR